MKWKRSPDSEHENWYLHDDNGSYVGLLARYRGPSVNLEHHGYNFLLDGQWRFKGYQGTLEEAQAMALLFL
jgi:hypothetical protein